MLYRTFGKTGEKVSVLGYGNMRLPVVNNDYGVVDVDAAMKIVRHAIDNGVNYLDTSWPYHSTSLEGGGSSEPFVGKVLKEVGRDKVFVATKLPIWLVKSREDMDSFLEKQLERLGTDYVDFYLVHMINSSRWANLLQQNLGDFLDKALASGKVRYVGFSFHDKPAQGPCKGPWRSRHGACHGRPSGGRPARGSKENLCRERHRPFPRGLVLALGMGSAGALAPLERHEHHGAGGGKPAPGRGSRNTAHLRGAGCHRQGAQVSLRSVRNTLHTVQSLLLPQADKFYNVISPVSSF